MITIIIDGKEYKFYGDELTSAEQAAILFLKERDKLKEEF